MARVGHVDHVAQLPVGTSQRRRRGEVYGQRQRRVEGAGLGGPDVDGCRVDLDGVARRAPGLAARGAAALHLGAIADTSSALI